MNSFNIILITVDSLRYDYFTHFMPLLRKFSDKWIVFNNAFSQGSSTIPAIPRLLTSSYNDYSLVKIGSATPIDISELSYVPFAGILKSQGYKTAAFHSNTFLSERFGYSKGFDTFYDFLEESTDVVKNFCKKFLKFSTGDIINKRAMKWMRNNKKNLFFMWLHYMDCHGPYIKNNYNIFEIYRQRKLWKKFCNAPHLITDSELSMIKRFYQKQILYMDKLLYCLLSDLEKNNLLENTVVIITADHGEEFLEHGASTHGEHVYDELIHVPLLISHPCYEKSTINELVGHIDILPTILEMLDIKGHNNLDGKSFFGLIDGNRGQKNNNRKKIFSEGGYLGDIYCLRTLQWKYLIDNKRNLRQLFNLTADPEERNNLIDSGINVQQKLESELSKFIANKKESKTLREQDDEYIRSQLSDLGYL